MQESTYRRMSRTGAGASAALGALALALASSAGAATPPAAGAGGWTAPSTLDTSTGQLVTPAVVGSDARGDSLAAWQDGSTIKAAVRPAGGAYSAPATVFTSGGSLAAPSVAVNARGDAALAWTASDDHGTSSVYLETRPAGGPISGPKVVASGPSDQAIVVGIDPSGTLTVAYLNGTGMAVQSGRVGGPLSAPQTFPGDDSPPVLGVSGQGDAVVAFTNDDPDPNVHGLYATSRAGTGPFPAPTQLAGNSAQEPTASIDSRGDATVAWQQFNADYSSDVVVSRARTPGQFGPPQTVSAAGAGNPVLAENRAGLTLLAWTISGDSAQLATAQPQQAFGVPVTESSAATGTYPASPAVAIAADGSGVLAWSAYLGGMHVVDAVTRTASGQLSPATTISSTAANSSFPSVAAGLGGADAAGWGSSADDPVGTALVSNHLGGH